MDFKEIMSTLDRVGDEQTKKTLMRHGAKEPLFGVKVAELKKILKKTKKNHDLSLALYDTGNSDAMYLAGLMADETKISKSQLNKWVKSAYWSYLSEFTVPWVAAETPHALELALEWIESEKETIASAGWSTLGSYVGYVDDSLIDEKMIKGLLKRVEKDIDNVPNRVKYTMNGFVIAVGSYMKELTDIAMETAARLGKVEVDMKGTACKVPLATTYIQKVIDKNRVGNKRKTARC